LGTTLSLGQAVGLGTRTLGLILGLVVLAMTIGFLYARLFRLTGNVGTLIGAGTAICGASAILIVSPLVKAKSEETAYALTTIFAFNLVALGVYPWFGHQLHLSAIGFGTWAGTAINDTSVVVATGYVFSSAAGLVATVVKLTRTTLVVPVALVIGLTHKGPKGTDLVSGVRNAVPWFVLAFLAMSLARTLDLVPASLGSSIGQLATFLIASVLGAVGLNTDLRSLVSLGWRPLAVGFLLATTMGVISLAAIAAFHIQ
jgi:uncharacterized integral membrane protein (TIGR00698 family)